MPKGVYPRNKGHRAILAKAREASNIACTGSHHSQTTKDKMSAYWTPKRRAEQSARMIGKQYGLGHHHTDETRAKMSVSHMGKPKSEKHKANMRKPKSEQHKANISAGRITYLCSPAGRAQTARIIPIAQAVARQTQTMSKLHRALILNLAEEYSHLVVEKIFGKYSVDVYVPEIHTAFEADGAYWHSKPGAKEHDMARDAWLMKQFDLPVVRHDETKLLEA